MMALLPPPAVDSVTVPPPCSVVLPRSCSTVLLPLPPFTWKLPWLLIVPMMSVVLPSGPVYVLPLLNVNAPWVLPSSTAVPEVSSVPPLSVFSVPPWMVPATATVVHNVVDRQHSTVAGFQQAGVGDVSPAVQRQRSAQRTARGVRIDRGRIAERQAAIPDDALSLDGVVDVGQG